MQLMYYIGVDVHKRIISFCVKARRFRSHGGHFALRSYSMETPPSSHELNNNDGQKC